MGNSRGGNAIRHYIAPRLIGHEITNLNHLTHVVQGAIEKNTSAKAAVEIALYDLPLDTPARYRAEVAAMRTEELTRLARAYLFPDQALVVAVGPAEVLMPQLAELGTPQLWRPPASAGSA